MTLKLVLFLQLALRSNLCQSAFEIKKKKKNTGFYFKIIFPLSYLLLLILYIFKTKLLGFLLILVLFFSPGNDHGDEM